MKKHLLGGLSALLVFMPVFVIGADGRGQGHEMSSSKRISNVGCTSVINSSSCDYTGPVKSLRKGYEYEFSDEFWAGSQDRRMKNFCAQFKEQSEYGDFNRGTNPNFKWTSDIANNGYWVNKNSSIVVIKADKLYQIKDVPDSRSEDNLFIKYVIEYANNEAATTRYHHTECFPYEISRCGDGVVDEDWFKKDPNDPAEECDYNDPNKAGWKDGSGKTCSKSCKLVDIVPACSSTYNGKTQYTSSANLWLKSTDNLCDEGEVVDFSYTGSPRTYTWNCKNGSKKTDSSCTAKQERCGDGTINGNEDCDDGEKNGTNTSSCSTKCTIVGGASCGTKNGGSTYFDSKQTTSWLSKATEGLCPDGLTVGTPIITGLDSHVEWTCSNTNGAEKICKAYQEYCGDSIKNGEEDCDGTEFCDSQCNKITPSEGCDQTFTGHLRLGENKVFSDNFNASWRDRYLFYQDVDFKENHGDYNNGSNPVFKRTSQLESNGMMVGANKSMTIIESTPYRIVSTPTTRARDNLYVEYNVWYDIVSHTTVPSKSNLYSHRECVYYEISRCGDGVVDEGYETCDPEAPEWKNGNNGKTCNPVTCEPETVPTKGDLDIDKTLVGSGLVNKTGDIVTWNIKVTARGGDVTDFIVTDKLPEVLEYSSYSVVHNPGGLTVLDPVLSGNQVIWSVNGTLKDGDYLTIQLKTKAKWMPKVDYKNVACVRPADDPNGDDCDEEEVKLGGLKVEKTLIGPKEIKEVGDIVQWTLKVTAEGGAVKNPVIQDKMPDVLGFTGYSVVRNGGLSISEPTISGNLVTWKTSGVLADGDYIEIRVDTYAKVMPEKEEKNVLCAWPEDKPEDEKCDNEPVHSPNLWIKKAFRDGSKEKTVKVGDIIAYKIDFGNKGNAAATITSIKDFLPKNVEYVSSEIYIISGSNSHLLNGSEVINAGTKVEGVYVDVYGGITLNPNTEGYIILTGKILGDYTGNTQNWACIYLNDKKIDCDWAKHNFTGDVTGDVMCKIPALSPTSATACSPVVGSTSVTCNSDGGIADTISIICDGVVTKTGTNISSLNGSCSFSGEGKHKVQCEVNGKTKDVNGNSCEGEFTLTKYCGGSGEDPHCKKAEVTPTSNEFVRKVTCETSNKGNYYIGIKCSKDDVMHYSDVETGSFTYTCDYTNSGYNTYDVKCFVPKYRSNGKPTETDTLPSCANKITITNPGGSSGGGHGHKDEIFVDGMSCFNVNAGNISIETGEILPFYRNIEKLADSFEKGLYVEYETGTYKYGDKNNYDAIKGQSCSKEGTYALNSLLCTFKITNGTGKVVYSDTYPCLSDESSKVAGYPLIQQWMNWSLTQYATGLNKQKVVWTYAPYGDDPMGTKKYAFRSNIYYIKNFGNKESFFGEYKITLQQVDYLYCDENKKWSAGTPYKSVCESNFVLTNGYTVQKTPSGNFTNTSTDRLKNYLYMNGSSVMSSLLVNSVVDTTDYNPNTSVKGAMTSFINKYSKLSVKVKETKDKSISKVPGKSIYFVKGEINLGGNDSDIKFDKPFTVVQLEGNTTIYGSVDKYNMMLLTQGSITFVGDCLHDQTIKGILYAENGLTRKSVKKNDSLDNNFWCTKGGLHIKGVLIGGGLREVMNASRSHLDNWFNTTDKAKTVMNGASVLIEYSPSIFTKSTMPPGAEDFTTALTVYKN